MTAHWAGDFFGPTYLAADADLHDPDLTRAMIGWVVAALPIRPGAELLDLACGTGRHSVPLAAAGFRVTGVDLAEDYLARARDRAARAGQHVRFVRADMRELSALAPRRFDAVVSLHTSLGFYDTATDLAVLREVRRRLRPGGRLCLDVLNRDWLLRQAPDGPDFVLTDVSSRHGTAYRHEERFDPFTSRVRWTIRPAAGPAVTADYRVYSAHELLALLADAGFAVRALHGDYDRSRFHVGSPHLLAIADAPG